MGNDFNLIFGLIFLVLGYVELLDRRYLISLAFGSLSILDFCLYFGVI